MEPMTAIALIGLVVLAFVALGVAVPPPLVPGFSMGFWLWSNQYDKTTSYTLTAAFNGGLFTNAGAVGSVTFTLPAIAPNLKFGFRVVANQTVTVSSAEGTNIVTFNNASASSLAFSTSSAKIGGGLILESNADGTKWYATVISGDPANNTLTIA
jgi:hypothetical protein